MNPSSTSLLCLTCLALHTACTRNTERAGAPSGQTQAVEASARTGIASPVPPTRYPYPLFLGSSVYHVEQEPEPSRLVLEFSKWTGTPEGEKDAVFRVTNRGTRPVLVWNVRQQVSTPGANEVGSNPWQTQQDGYPGRGWDQPVIPAGGSAEFPMVPGSEDLWRVCLLYSRERPDSQPSHRLFDGTFESVGPGMRTADATEAP